MTKFLTSNTTSGKLARTIAQGIIAVLIQNLAEYLNLLKFTPETVALLTPLIMVVLSALMSILGDKTTNNISNPKEEDLPVQANSNMVDEASVRDVPINNANPSDTSNEYIERSASNVNGL